MGNALKIPGSGDPVFHVLLTTDLLQGVHDLGFRVIQHGSAAGLDNAALGPGNLGEGVSKVLRVFQTDIGDDGCLRTVDDIGGVQFTAHPDLQDDNVAVFFQKILHGNGCDQLKLAGMVLHGVGTAADLFRDAGEILAGNVLPVQLHALAEVLDIGRGVESGPVTGTPENRFQHDTGRALAVAAGDMDELQLLLWIPQGMKELTCPVKTETRGAPGIVFDIGNGFLHSHVVGTFFP